MADQNLFNMSETWTSGVTTYTAILMNVTDSASASGSKLIDLQISGNSKFNVDKNGNATLSNTDAGASAGPVLTFYRDSASPAVSDIIGKLLFQGEDSGGNTEDYSEIYTQIADPTSGSEDATIYLRTKIAGTMTTVMTLSASGLAVAGAMAVTGDILPEADGTRDLGSSSVRWAETHSDTVLTDLLRGATTAGSIPVRGEGAANTNLQQGLAKAWANLNGTGTVALRDSFNVTSVTDNGTGDYTFNLTSAMANANYAYSTDVGHTSTQLVTLNIDTYQTVSSLRVGTRIITSITGSSTAEDAHEVQMTIHGDLA